MVELLDAAGNAFAAYRYDAWGNPQGVGNVGAGIWAQATSLIDATLAADIAVRQVLRYAGYCYDAESGLYYLSARYYDPRTGQFLTKDPARSDGEASGYQYCGGNPVGYMDPSGICRAPNPKTEPPALSENGHAQWRLRPPPRNTLAGGLRFVYEAYQAGEISEEEWQFVLAMQNSVVETPGGVDALRASLSEPSGAGEEWACLGENSGEGVASEKYARKGIDGAPLSAATWGWLEKAGAAIQWVGGKLKNGFYWVAANGKKIFFIVTGSVIIVQGTILTFGCAALGPVGALVVGAAGVAAGVYGGAVVQRGLDMEWR